MNKLVYPKLAAQNLHKNRQFYLPYILTVLGTAAAFYILAALANTKPTSTQTRYYSLSIYMSIGLVVVGLFSVIFLFYTNSFLMKRRGKELGLYNVLGMGKRNIAAMLGFETLYVALIGIVGGIALGTLLQKLMTMLVTKLMGGADVKFPFQLSPAAMALTAILFGAILLLTLLVNLGRVAKLRPVELMHSGSAAEREPKTRWLLALLGVGCLGTGYWIAVAVKSAMEALGLYFVAVLLVIIGTYCLFLAGSIAVLKLLKKRKNYYYKANHFISVSGMLYRMKQNAVGLANICILSTMVLVTVACTVSLYAGLNGIIESSYPHDITASFFAPTEQCRAEIEDVIAETEQETGISVGNYILYSALTGNWLMDGSEVVAPSAGGEQNVDLNYGYFCIMTAADWEALTGRHYELSGHEVALGEVSGALPDRFTIMGEEFSVKDRFTDAPADGPLSTYVSDNLFYVIVPDSDMLIHLTQVYNDDNASDSPDTLPTMRLSLDIGGTKEQNKAFTDSIVSRLTAPSGASSSFDSLSYNTKSGNLEMIYSLYGGFLFLGILLGILFLMATVLIIYYKQIIEGYDDRARFEILQKVGMDKKLIAASVRSQILTMFLLPLGAAALHLAVAFPLLTRVLKAMMLNNTPLFFTCTLATFGAFAAVYLVVYAFTSRVYYRIVSSRESR